MAVLVYINSENGIGKNAYEVVTYAKKLEEEIIVITTGHMDESSLLRLGEYGAKKILIDSSFSGKDSQQLTRIIDSAVESTNANTIVFSHDTFAKKIAPRLSVKLKAGLISGAIEIPNGDKVKVNVFSGKAFGNVKVCSEKRIISVLPNSIQPEKNESNCIIENFNGNAGDTRIKLIDTKKIEGDIPLPEAELVISGGRGLKGPENWNIIEDLAKELGAATACSRPVSDIGWRPHNEHVGQTGIAIRPNLYIAAGISGAIQHLAGVNGSKTIVVINTDSEAPFFRAANYGIIGDAFEVLPKLTESIKKFKASN